MQDLELSTSATLFNERARKWEISDKRLDQLKREGCLPAASPNRRYPRSVLRMLDVIGKHPDESYDVLRFRLWIIERLPLPDRGRWLEDRIEDLLWMQSESQAHLPIDQVRSLVAQIQGSRHQRHLVDRRKVREPGADVELASRMIELTINPDAPKALAPAVSDGVETLTGVPLNKAHLPDQGVSLVGREIRDLREGAELAREKPLLADAIRDEVLQLINELPHKAFDVFFRPSHSPAVQRAQRAIIGMLFGVSLARFQQPILKR